MTLLAVVTFAVLLSLVYWLFSRHWHRWSPWDGPVVRQSGRITQSRRCRVAACNRHQIKNVKQ